MNICEEEMEIMVIDSNERSQSDELDCSTLIRDIPGSNSIETRFSFLSYLLYKLWRYFWNSLVQGDEWRWNNNNRKYEAWKEEVTTHDKKRDEKSKKIMESGVEEVSKISTRERLDYDSIKIVHFLRRILRRMICSISERIRSVINYKLGDGFRGYLEDLLQSQVEQH